MRIVLTSNCQTAGLSAALGALTNGADICPFPISRLGSAEGRKALRDLLTKGSVWATMSSPNTEEISRSLSDVRVVRLPTLQFVAFHPDQVYVESDGRPRPSIGGMQYHSAIAFGAYRAGKSVEKTEELFQKDALESLGYFSQWDSSVEHMRQSFKETDIAFEPVMLRLLRAGIFMHTINHPKIEALLAIASQVAKTLGLTANATLDASCIPDGLATRAIWPVYPPIAETYGVQGTFVWRLPDGRYLSSLRQFLSEAFTGYDASNINGCEVRGRGAQFFNRLEAAA